MTGRLVGKTALVTGAATGIGRAVAERFAVEGAKVVLFGLDGEALEAVSRACGGLAVEGDVTRTADIARAIAACGGTLDIVVNAAGVIALDAPARMADETWRRVFSVNVDGPMAVCRAALPSLIAARGCIVNVASVAAFNASPNTASYAASKSALVSYTRSIAHAHGADGVRANCVAPGWVRTPMSEMEMRLAADASGSTAEAEFAALAARIALGRIAAAAEIAACCLFLASEDASFVTGAVLIADGGGRSPVAGKAA
ncbi:SDR family oxidoreductase [Bradyrhizobium sp.]|uniref:SDR family NAD(P)-dependent oxidoreductase n=1 Tax=Bradyrhizobium sp. TaxID=376 RepID=UPI0026269AB3|nr:SDR family oxidoreductase [Bradyrhizobium sp.]